jgi:hypothetical protein
MKKILQVDSGTDAHVKKFAAEILTEAENALGND